MQYILFTVVVQEPNLKYLYGMPAYSISVPQAGNKPVYKEGVETGCVSRQYLEQNDREKKSLKERT